MTDRTQAKAKAALEISKICSIPICDAIDSICTPEERNEVMDLCESATVAELEISKRTFH